jgi:hypothetical protein
LVEGKIERKCILIFQRASLTPANNKGLPSTTPQPVPKEPFYFPEAQTRFLPPEDSELVGPGQAHLPDVEAKGTHLTPAVNEKISALNSL